MKNGYKRELNVSQKSCGEGSSRAPMDGVDGIAGRRCILAGLSCDVPDGSTLEESLEELARLVETAGGSCVASLVQTRSGPDPKSYLGRGKVQEAAQLARRMGADCLVLVGEARPSQLAELSSETSLLVIDRPAVILEIFARHATTAAGKLQVEMAQLQRRFSRLAGKGVELSRLGGGIGTRGPGEQRIEVERRRLRAQIGRLRRKLEQLERVRASNRKLRMRRGVRVAALVGYTNSGKSTLLEALSGISTTVEDKLFSTLDPRTARAKLPKGRHRSGPDAQLLLTDTVGFVRALPPELVSAFHATLEEVRVADVLLHVIDMASPRAASQIRCVRDVLDRIGASEIPEIVVFNKCDLVPTQQRKSLARRLLRESGTPDGVPWVIASARQGWGTEDVLVTALAVLERAELGVASIHAAANQADHFPVNREPVGVDV